jgi:hypothetical protein
MILTNLRLRQSLPAHTEVGVRSYQLRSLWPGWPPPLPRGGYAARDLIGTGSSNKIGRGFFDRHLVVAEKPNHASVSLLRILYYVSDRVDVDVIGAVLARFDLDEFGHRSSHPALWGYRFHDLPVKHPQQVKGWGAESYRK